MIYERIEMLCREKGINFFKLETELGISNGSIKKWGRTRMPSIDKIAKVANYFGVSVDYLLGRTDIREPVEEIINDENIVSIQRAQEKLTPTDKNRMMAILKSAFDYAFSQEDNNGE